MFIEWGTFCDSSSNNLPWCRHERGGSWYDPIVDLCVRHVLWNYACPLSFNPILITLRTLHIHLFAQGIGYPAQGLYLNLLIVVLDEKIVIVLIRSFRCLSPPCTAEMFGVLLVLASRRSLQRKFSLSYRSGKSGYVRRRTKWSWISPSDRESENFWKSPFPALTGVDSSRLYVTWRLPWSRLPCSILRFEVFSPWEEF